MHRAALRIVQTGAIAIVPAVALLYTFELDRFFVPKELVLHLTALLAGWSALRVATSRVDRLLFAFLGLSAISAFFAANPWLAMRALAISVSGVVLFRVGRALREAELARPLLNVLALAVVLCSVTSLLQTYGADLAIFAENRAPGGTLGNRNFVAHVAAFGSPLVLLAALRGASVWPGAIGSAIAIASLVLTRSRAAWLAFAAVAVVFVIALLASNVVRRDGRTWRRLALIAVVIAGGVVAALVIPNTLNWRSDNPYLETVKRVADYQEGSGAGRLVQYQQSLRMALHHPLFGVGPGNWAADYPEYAARHDPSLSDNDGGMTTNPWPSSDWIAFVSERGPIAAIVLAVAFLLMSAGAIRQLRDAIEIDDALLAAALLGVIVGVGVTGMFDAVLLLALPAFLVWTTLGALYVPPHALPASRAIAIALVVLAGLGAARSAVQLTAMQIFVTKSDRTSLARAAMLDPGNFRLRLRLGRMGKRAQRCEDARAALSLFPHSDSAKNLARGCGN